jgi:hypothetical protein
LHIPFEIVLLPSPDDPKVHTREFQAELRALGKALNATGVKFSQPIFTMDAVDASGYALAEYLLKNVVPGAIPAIGTAFVAWITARNGRKARLKFGDVEAEGRNAEEIEKLLRLVPSLSPEAERLETKRLNEEAQLQRRTEAFSATFIDASTDELFRSFRALEGAQKVAVKGNAEGESEDLLFKRVAIEIEIFKRHPNGWQAAYRDWEKSQK